MFNPKEFLQQTVNAPMATKITPAPEGEWVAVISTKVPIEEWFGEAKWKDKSTHQEKTQPTAKIPFEITDERAKELVKRQTLLVTYDMFLDLLPNGHLDTGEDKNVRLGALRDALSQNNDPNWSWQSLWGAGPLVVKIVHSKDEKRPDEVFAKISRVSRIR